MMWTVTSDRASLTCVSTMGPDMTTAPLADAALHARRAIRQIDRLQDTFVAMWRHQEANPNPDGWITGAYRDQNDAFEDQVYFLAVAARQAVRAQDALRSLSVDVPRIRDSDLIVAWRDVEEHWDDPVVKGKPIRALKRWQQILGLNEGPSPSSRPQGWRALTGPDEYRLTRIREVSVGQLAIDLQLFLHKVESLLDEQFEAEWLDEARAAAYVGLEDMPKSSPCPGLVLIDWPEKGFRYELASLNRWKRCMENLHPRGNAESESDKPDSRSHDSRE